jgi:succinate-acetate transporter protein
MGFLALMVATSTLAAVQLGWLEPAQGRDAAVAAVLLTAPVQIIAAVFGFLARDPVAGTGMAILSGTWAVIGAVTLVTPPGHTSPGLGVVLLGSAAALLVPTVSGTGKAVAAAVMGCTALRFAVTGVLELTGDAVWKTVAGAVGLALGALAFYAALAFELEGVKGRTVLPTGRPSPVTGEEAGVGRPL